MVSAADLFEKILVYLVQKPSYGYYIEDVRKNRGMNFKTKESKAKVLPVRVFSWGVCTFQKTTELTACVSCSF